MCTVPLLQETSDQSPQNDAAKKNDREKASVRFAGDQSCEHSVPAPMALHFSQRVQRVFINCELLKM